MKSYPSESKADALALYLSGAGRTLASAAEDLGMCRLRRVGVAGPSYAELSLTHLDHNAEYVPKCNFNLH